ncbi:ribose 5-phosphate isomerase B [Oleisolibacter albus]|uniref:ribose 5-phosphate isomerase B n=1 Tax=Oleisolibacter albus TaxID=2171757 RepID=UPI000DF14188|nr:ribose 5-phosphate isomerase B [Oleisolibacter albus]
MSSTDSITIAIASDHAGVEMKAALRALLEGQGRTVLDLGTDGAASVDYPDFADAVAAALADGRATLGVLICGTGIGISIAANRHRHVRAALCHSSTDARLSRQHNNANVLVLGARTTGIEVAKDCVAAFFATDFEGGRHAARVAKFS